LDLRGLSTRSIDKLTTVRPKLNDVKSVKMYIQCAEERKYVLVLCDCI